MAKGGMSRQQSGGSSSAKADSEERITVGQGQADAKAALAAAHEEGPVFVVRNKAALVVFSLAATVGISASVAALVASAIVSGAREERAASVDAVLFSARRMDSANGTVLAAAPEFCLDAEAGEMCHRLVTWIQEDGVRFDPEKYAGVTARTTFHEVQALAHTHHPDLCAPPCGKAPPSPTGPEAEGDHGHINCDYGHEDSKPAHAGCFVVHNGRLLAERLTYDHEKYDVPGGQTNWREPARCTAYRETYEETGYLVAPRELLAVVRNDFHLYRCELLRPDPVKGHDHEISWVGWLDVNEIRAKASQHMWRFPESHRYAGWIR